MPLPECFHCKYGEAGFPCRRADGSFDFEKTGAAIVAIGRTFADDFDGDAEAVREELDWASDCEYEINQDHPDMLLGLTAGAMDACENPRDAAFVAAGPLENAVVKHGPLLIGKIEILAARSAKFRYFLSAIWGQSRCDPDVWARVCKAVGHEGIMDTEGRGPSDGAHVNALDDGEALALILKERVGEAARGVI